MLRKIFISFMLLVFASLFSATVLHAYGNDFSCPFGKQGACLDYDDKVCSSNAKCVSSNAVCFNSYTCNYQGFVCKSEFDEVVDEYNDLLGNCKEVANEYDDLLVSYKKVMNKYEDLLDRYKTLESNHDTMKICLTYASSLEAARACY